jgi:DNA polymerase (family 10)
VENAAIARVLGEIADLLEIRGENPFRIRAYRNASLAVADAATRLATLSDAELRTIPGIGKDISARVRELIDTGGAAYHEELKAEFPAGSSTCCDCRASAQKRSLCCTAVWASARSTSLPRPLRPAASAG